MQRIIALLDCLQTFAAFSNLPALSSLGFNYDQALSKNERLNKIYHFVLHNFKKKITLLEVASIIDLTPHSFCRYFKSRTRKTYTQFITEIRVGHACKLLIEDSMNVKQICYESGFHNFASFHKHFKVITGMSPLNYQKSFLKK